MGAIKVKKEEELTYSGCKVSDLFMCCTMRMYGICYITCVLFIACVIWNALLSSLVNAINKYVLLYS